jgi:hypothetical protein
MRLFEFEDAGGEEQTDDSEVDFNPLMPDVQSLLLRLEASNVQRVKVEDFIYELNNILNVPINMNDAGQINNVKKVIADTKKAEIKGDYVLVNYQSPSSPGETDTQKIAMKNLRNKT